MCTRRAMRQASGLWFCLFMQLVPCHLRPLADLISTGLLIVPQGSRACVERLHRGCGLAAGVIFRSCMSSCVPDSCVIVSDKRGLSVGHAVSFRLGSSGPMSTAARLVPVWKIIVVVVIDTHHLYTVAFSGPTPGT